MYRCAERENRSDHRGRTPGRRLWPGVESMRP